MREFDILNDQLIAFFGQKTLLFYALAVFAEIGNVEGFVQLNDIFDINQGVAVCQNKIIARALQGGYPVFQSSYCIKYFILRMENDSVQTAFKLHVSDFRDFEGGQSRVPLGVTGYRHTAQ